jgi:gamma-glutamylcyclotransferase (GGCT)/AIG2-like uncharacterized protein YtfP
MTNLFVYGALMYEEVWRRIVSGEFRKINGQVSGYRRLAVKNEEYPGLVEGEGVVPGCIWFALDDDNLTRLDVFEGEYYERVPALALDDAGNRVQVHVYRFRGEFEDLLEEHDWNVEKFESTGLTKFLSRYVGFDHV